MKTKWMKGQKTCVLAAAIVGGSTVSAAAQDLASLEARIAALESEKAVAAPVTAGPGVNLSFYGYAKLDLVGDNNYDLGYTTGGMASVGADSIVDGGSGASAFESRLGVKGSVDTDLGELRFNLEGDFFGAPGGSGNFRLRHAYGEIGSVLAGQTWTNWMPFEGAPSTIQDFNGAAGGSNYRVPQLRYTFKPNDQVRLSLALEEDYAPGTQSSLALTAFGGYTSSKVKAGLGLIARTLETNVDDTVHGFGYALGADFEVWEGGKLQLQYVGGKGISTVLNNAGAATIDIATGGKFAYDIDANGDAIKAHGLKAGMFHKVNEKSDISLSHGMQRYDDYAGAVPSATKQINSTYLTYRYFASKQVMLAGELSYIEREQFDGASFDNTRLQGVIKFTF